MPETLSKVGGAADEDIGPVASHLCLIMVEQCRAGEGLHNVGYLNFPAAKLPVVIVSSGSRVLIHLLRRRHRRGPAVYPVGLRAKKFRCTIFKRR